MRNEILSWASAAVSTSAAEEIDRRLSEPHRYYHGWYHIEKMWRAQVESDRWDDNARLAILYHDLVYDIPSSTNEEASVRLMTEHLAGSRYDVETIQELIMGTKPAEWVSVERYHGPVRDFVVNLDLLGLQSAGDTLTASTLLAKEFQMHPWSDYKRGTRQIMDSLPFAECRVGVETTKAWLERSRPSIGVYAGTFGPLHIGHASVIRRAEDIFDKVVILCAINPKKRSVSAEERAVCVRQALPYHEVRPWSGLLVDFIRLYRESGCRVHLIRGLRTDTDFAQEEVNRRWMEQFMGDVSVSYIPCDADKQHVSSSGMTALVDFDGTEDILKSLVIDTDRHYRDARDRFVKSVT